MYTYIYIYIKGHSHRAFTAFYAAFTRRKNYRNLKYVHIEKAVTLSIM